MVVISDSRSVDLSVAAFVAIMSSRERYVLVFRRIL
jgi:hypothetical protein